MAYSIKYLFKFESAAGTTREIRVLKDGYSGAVIQRPLGRAPILKKQQNGPVHGTSLEFFAECNVDREFIEFYTSNPKDYRVDLYAGSTLLWQGYITPELYSEPDIAPPYDVQVVATDGVGELKLYDYTAQGTVTLRTLLSGLLSRTGLGTDIYLISSLKPGSAGAGSLLEKTINLDYMAGQTCYEVLTYILDTLHATITWWKGAWILTRETNVTFTNGKVRYFNTAGNSALLNDSVQVLGKMYTNPAWPVGQLSTVIDPAKNRVTVQAPWHVVTCLRNSDMGSDSDWVKAKNARYETDGYVLPININTGTSETAVISQATSMAGLRVPMSLSVKATGATSEISAQVVGAVLGVLLTYKVGNETYHLVKGDDGVPVWQQGDDISTYIPLRTRIDFQQQLATWDSSRIEAEELTIDNIPPFLQGTTFPAGTLTVYILGYCAKIYGAYLDVVLPKGYQDILRIDNGARGEGSEVEIAIGRETADNAYYAAFLQGLLLDSGNLITSFSDANFPGGMDYLAFIARDYALSVSLPRAKVTGTVYLESGIAAPPLVFTKGALNYWLQTWSWNLYEDELEIEGLTLPSASLTVESETILESTAGASSSSGRTSGGGGGSIAPGVSMAAVQEWVNGQGFATETWVTAKGYLTGITEDMIADALGYTPLAPDDLLGYATRSWVTSQGYLTGITATDIETALDYIPVSPTDLTTALGGYLPLTAGTAKPLTGDLYIITGDTDKCIQFSYDTRHLAGAAWRIISEGTGNLDTNYLSFQTGGSSSSATTWETVLRMTMDTRRVGINMDAPAYQLDVNGTARVTSLKIGSATITWNSNGYLHIDQPLVTAGDQIVISGTPGGGGGGGATTLAGLDDTNITNPQTGQILSWNGTKWVNTNAPTGSITSVSLAQGATNGTLHLVVNGTAQSDVAVTGLGSMAYETASNYQPKDADLTAIAGLSGTSGFLKKTAANTWSLDTNTYLTGITSTMVTNALGYTPANSTALANYLPLTGGTIKNGNAGTPLTLDTTSGTIGIYFATSATSKAWVGYQPTYGSVIYSQASSKYLGIKDDGTPHYNGNTLWHAGNLDSAAVQTIIGSGVYHPYGGGQINFSTSHLFVDEYASVLPRPQKAYVVINKGTDYFGMGASASNISVMALGTTSDQFGTWKRETMFFTDDGKVGVGSIPSYTFDVNGTARVTSLKIGSATITWNSNGYLHIDQPLVTAGDQIVISGTPGGGGGGGATTLAGLDDVAITSVANGQLLQYNGSKWVNVAASSVGGVTSVAGYTGAVTAAQISSAIGLSDYLPKTGGTIKNGSISGPLTLDTDSAYEVGLQLYLAGVRKAWVGYNTTYGAYLWNAASNKYLGIKDDGTPHYQGNTLLHAGNYTSYVNTTNFPGLDKVGTVTSVTLASGTNNGTLKLTVNGTNTDNIAVTGLGSLAYKSSLVASDIPDISELYLPKIGGTLQSATNNLLTLNNTASNPGGIYILFQENGTKVAEFGYWNTTYGAYIQNRAGTTAHTLSLRDGGSLYLDNYVVYHAGNANKNDVSWTAYQITAWGSVYANRYQGAGNSAGGSIVINKGGDYWGMGPSSSNVSVFAMGTTTDATGTWKSIVVTITDAGAMTLASSLSATTLTSTVATGTAPLSVTSTTVVSNLNADMLDGQHGSYYATASSVTTLQGYFTNGAAKTARTLSSLSRDNTVWYDTQYPVLAQWDDNTHLRLKCLNAAGTASYDVRVNAADKFVTSRALWGQSFDGTANVTGALSSVTNIDSLLYFDTTNSRVGVGVSSPSYAFHCAGDICTNTYLRINAWTGYGTGSATMWYNATNAYMELNTSLFATSARFGGANGVCIGRTYAGATTASTNDLIERGVSGGVLYLQYNHNGGICMCYGGGNVAIGSAVQSGYKLYVNGGAYASSLTSPVAYLGRAGGNGLYLHSQTSNGTGYYNGANIVLNAPGSYWRGIGYSGFSDTLTIGPCSDEKGTWAANASITLRVMGTVFSTGDQVVSSDLTLKTNLTPVTYSVSDIAKARAVEFDWKDGRGHSMGSIAQDWLGIAPALVHGEEGNMSLAYGQLALVNTIIEARAIESLQVHESEQDKEIRELRERVARLEMENERLRMN